ncbi:flagellar protein FlaG [Cupriavidus taiwanensis]|uniref:FlaG: Flagellar protein n=1 Tax=Cupriavidus taiwanensis TaxID=164546 RepID=A0A976A8H7_9BURK|nr:flagellar protein FlaG [Cupriavidus taiwanensis]NSX17119.1 flagellar protein FlaG [Cupriavidus taiwanensis]SOY68070.1 FlaG: Flagellar protein [Cupriavidus taiwanensis]
MAPSPTVNPGTVRLPRDVFSGASVPATASSVAAGERDAAPVAATPARALPGTHGADTDAALRELGETLKATSIGLRFEIDEDTHRVVTKVIDKETGELIRQVPTEEVMRIARAIDKLQGLFISQTA